LWGQLAVGWDDLIEKEMYLSIGVFDLFSCKILLTIAQWS